MFRASGAEQVATGYVNPNEAVQHSNLAKVAGRAVRLASGDACLAYVGSYNFANDIFGLEVRELAISIT